jgi:thiamine biosynthesis protein ThiS
MKSECAKIVANGRVESVGLPCTVWDFVLSRGWKPTQVVVEVNGKVLARSEFAGAQLKEGDRLEVIVPVAGG